MPNQSASSALVQTSSVLQPGNAQESAICASRRTEHELDQLCRVRLLVRN